MFLSLNGTLLNFFLQICEIVRFEWHRQKINGLLPSSKYMHDIKIYFKKIGELSFISEGITTSLAKLAKNCWLTLWWPWFGSPLCPGSGVNFSNTLIEPSTIWCHSVVCLRWENNKTNTSPTTWFLEINVFYISDIQREPSTSTRWACVYAEMIHLHMKLHQQKLHRTVKHRLCSPQIHQE